MQIELRLARNKRFLELQMFNAFRPPNLHKTPCCTLGFIVRLFIRLLNAKSQRMKIKNNIISKVAKLESEIKQLNQTIRKLQHEYDISRGLWCVDKNPKNVSIEWIRANAFQLT